MNKLSTFFVYTDKHDTPFLVEAEDQESAIEFVASHPWASGVDSFVAMDVQNSPNHPVRVLPAENIFPKEQELVTGFTCGSFDLCHYGHVLMFEECKKHCDVLIVGVQSDPTIDRPDKNKPIQSMEERVGQVEALKAVDVVYKYHTEEDLVDLLIQLNPEVRFVGADWEGKPFTGHELDISVIFNSRDHAYSSSELRERIFKAELDKMNFRSER